jgi:predicted transcriptional regulator|tara:strand:+ start:4690 stop:4986 length:297 start_codon:yes stop_codon:yes gene_type:complete
MIKTDICENKHQQNAESIEANPSIRKKNIDRSRVFQIIKKTYGGITSKEIAEKIGRPLNCISGRISELKRDGRIEVVGRRDGCAILKTKKERMYGWND